jgi:hypothetical protein
MRPGLYRWATQHGAQGTARIADLEAAGWVPVAGDGRYGAMLYWRRARWWERVWGLTNRVRGVYKRGGWRPYGDNVMSSPNSTPDSPKGDHAPCGGVTRSPP